MANWRSHRETVHFFGPNGETFGGFGRKWHIPSTCLDAFKRWVAIGIYSISRVSE